VLKVNSWYDRVTSEGYQPIFKSAPRQYQERNNRSALDNLEFIREKVKEWESDGFISQQAQPSLCVNPLTVVTKVDPESGKIKQRLCLDCSRYVNKLLEHQATNLEDIFTISEMELKDGFCCVFDLENQYFHVWLAPEAKKYFGFAVPDKAGRMQYYVFNIMVYGISTAAAIVTRLTKPIQSFLHDQGLRTSIYIDDGRICAASKEETELGMRLAVKSYVLAGWNIQWKKTDMKASQQVKFLGFIIDLSAFTYTAESGKEKEVLEGAKVICSHIEQKKAIPTRQVARLLGKMASMRVSHGSVVFLSTRSVQHQMGAVVLKDGWDGSITLSDRVGRELAWVIQNFQMFNGRGIRDEKGEEVLFSLQDTQRFQAEHSALQASEAALWVQEQSTSWTAPLDGKLKELEDFPGGTSGVQVSAGVQELEVIVRWLKSAARANPLSRWTRIVWHTSSRNCHHFCIKGSRQENIQDLVLSLKNEEAATHTEVKVIWVTNISAVIAEADGRSQQYSSTDEWGLVQEEFQAVVQKFQLQPTVDAFATRKNSVCQSFFSKWPQIGSAGIDFFSQRLSSEEVYYCCPPVAAAAHKIQRLLREEKITAIVVLPAWKSALHWAMLKDGRRFIPEIKDSMTWEGHCQDSGRGKSLLSRGTGIRLWAGLFKSGESA